MSRHDAPLDLQSFAESLRLAGRLIDVQAEVDSNLELPEIARRVMSVDGPALVFWNVRGSRFPVATGLFGTRERVELAFGNAPGKLIERLADLPRELPTSLGRLWPRRGLLAELSNAGPKEVPLSAVARNVLNPPRLTSLNAPRAWPRDAGPMLPFALVTTQDPVTREPNLGLYQAQIFDDDALGLYLPVGSGASFHLARAEERGQPLPVHVHIGGPPAALLAALSPLPENVSEFLLAGLLLGRRLPIKRDRTTRLPYLADAEFVLQGHIEVGARRSLGPFGTRYGTYSERHPYPLVKVERVLHRKDALLATTVPGLPHQEHELLAEYLQEMITPLLPLALPGVRGLWCYGEAGFRAVTSAVVHERYARESITTAFRLLGSTRLSLTKFLLVLDEPRDLRDFRATLTYVLERADFTRDLYLLGSTANDSLDRTGPRIHEGSKCILVGVGDKRRELPTEFTSPTTYAARKMCVISPGCVVVEAPSHREAPEIANTITNDPGFDGWPLVVLTDDLELATRSERDFLWTTFTRFDPAQDITAGRRELVDNHIAMHLPIVIDARRKAGYSEELSCDPETERRVRRRWREFFPGDGRPEPYEDARQ